MLRIAGKYIIILICLFLIGSCSKSELITGNIAPTDNTIENAQRRDYVNRLYISLIGEEPSEAILNQALTDLNNDNFSQNARIDLIADIQSDSDYGRRLFEIARAELLNSIDTLSIGQYIGIFTQLYNQSTDSAERAAYVEQILLLDSLSKCASDFNAGIINYPEMHKRCIRNFFFDELNMGAENYVVASFQHFLFRYPTTDELENGVNMIDGFQGVLFFQIGASKDQYNQIFLSSSSYAEGVVRDQFLRFLFREPTAEEAFIYSSDFVQDPDIRELQQQILSLDEYVGI